MASNGLPLKVDYSVGDIPPVDILFVCVGLTTEFPGKSKVLGALRSWGRRGGSARRAFGRVPPACRGRPTRRASLHDPLGKPRGLQGEVPRHRVHGQRVRDRPQAVHVRRRNDVDRPHAGDRAR